MGALRSTDGRRWALLQRHDIPDLLDPTDVYLTRWRIVQTPWGGVYLHAIRRPDHDRHLHDHPWSFASIILRGGYVEERETSAAVAIAIANMRDNHGLDLGRRRKFGVARVNVVRRGAFHSIRRLLRVPTWSLVLVGPRRSGWGYATAFGVIPHEPYHEGARAVAWESDGEAVTS